MSETIYFNGKKYNSASEMPSSVRQMYERLNRFFVDEDRDGVPDIIQSGGLAGIKETINMIKDIGQSSSTSGLQTGQMSIVRVTDTNIFVNGKAYASVAEMPNNIRREYERVIRSASDGTEDIFDESWRQVERSDYFKPHDDEIMNRQISQQYSNTEAPIKMVDSTGRFILIAAAAILIMGCFAAAWFYFL